MIISKNWLIIFLVVFSLFLANMLILDYLTLKKPQFVPLINSTVIEPTIVPAGQTEVLEEPGCPLACGEKIDEATKAALANLKAQPTAKLPVTVPQSEVKEFFIPFGGGQSQAEDWENLYGLEAYIDGSKYGNIKEAVFEATVQIPTGNEKVFVRLYNATDQHPVWNSEVSHEGGSPQILISGPVEMIKEKKLYRVQMKTSLKFLAILTQARVKITTE